MKTQNQSRIKLQLITSAAIVGLATFSQATVSNIAWYRLGENDPGAANGNPATTTAVDVMGVNNLKRFGIPRYTNDIPSGAATHLASTLAVEFNGVNQFYSNTVATTARNNFGLEAWTELSSATVGATYVVAHNGNTSANGWGIVAEIGTHSVTYRGFFGGGSGLTFGGGVANVSAHVAIVRDNGICTLYVNGRPAGSTNVTPVLPAGGFTIGGPTVPSASLALFPGTIDEVRVFTFATGQFSTNDLQINQRLINTLSVSNITRTTATLNGAAGSFEFPTTVWFEYGLTTNFGTVTAPQNLGAGFISSNFTASISGLNLGDTYYVRAVASNQLGVAYGFPLTFTTVGFLEGGGFALNFDGTNGYMSVGNNSFLNYREFAATAWINTTQTTGQVGIINKYVAGSSNGWQVAVIDGNVRAWYIANASNYIWDGGFGLNGGPIADGQWHHMAFVTDDTSGGFLYVDGILKDFLNWTGVPTSCTTTQELSLGRYPGGNGEFFRGSMDEVSVWEAITQSQDEIQGYMNRGLTGFEIGVYLYFRLNEGSGTFVQNSARYGSGFGQLQNGASWVTGLFLRPGIFTQRATAVTAGSAILKATGNPGLTNAVGWFEWGPTTSYGNVTPVLPLGSGGENTNFNQTITGLTENLTYHFRAVSSNGLGASFGLDASFIASSTNLITGRTYHTATLLPTGKVLIAGGRDIDFQTLASAELFDPITGKMSPASPMSVPRLSHTATLLPNGKVLVAGGEGVFPTYYASAELYDPVTGTWSPTGSMATNRYLHTATLLRNGKVLVVGGESPFSLGVVATTELYDPATGLWSSNTPLQTARRYQTASLLTNGEVLVAGGEGTNGSPLSTCERLNPTTGIWTPTGPMTTNRYLHCATLLPNGKVLAVGGYGSTALNTAELYDPIAGTWTNTGPMLNYRIGFTLTLLPNGRVLASGDGIGNPSLYDPLTGNWDEIPGPDPSSYSTATLMPNGKVLVAGGLYSIPWPDVSVYVTPDTSSISNAAPMTFGRYNHTATLLPNNQVLVASFTNSELYNVFTGTWSNTAPLNTARSSHTATILADGHVLAAGGYDSNLAVLRSAELYDTANRTWTATGNMSTNHVSHTATLLLSGKVLAAGGYAGTFTPPVAITELYDPKTGNWSTTGPMTTNRVGHTATLLPNGKVLVTGGTYVNSSFFTSLASAEMYDPASGLWTAINPMSTNRSGHKAVLLRNGTVLVAGGAPDWLSGALSSAEIFDPNTGLWKTIGSMTAGLRNATATTLLNEKILFVGGQSYSTNAQIFDPFTGLWSVAPPLSFGLESQSATLLPSGKVLIAGGFTSSGPTNAAFVYDVNTGFSNAWRSQITGVSPTLAQGGGSLAITGALFRGISEASGGGNQSSPVDFPLIQARSLENDFVWFIPATNWSTNTFNSAPMTGLPPGMARVVSYVDGIPGTSSVFSVLKPIASLTLSNLVQAFDGAAKTVSVFTVPPGLPVSVTYNGSANAPTNPGSYTVICTITDETYDSTPATNTLTITNAIPSPIQLTALPISSNGSFQISFSNSPNSAFSLLTTTDVSLPLSNWLVLARPIPQVSPGQFQFTDPHTTNNQQRFYRVRWP